MRQVPPTASAPPPFRAGAQGATPGPGCARVAAHPRRNDTHWPQPHSQHPYQYAYSNPVLRTDPSGKFAPAMAGSIAAGAGIGAGVEIGLQVADQYHRTGRVDLGNLCVEDIGYAALAGAIAGGGGFVAGTVARNAFGTRLLGSIAAGAAEGAVSDMVVTAATLTLRGEQVTADRMIQAALVGAVAGGIGGAIGWKWGPGRKYRSDNDHTINTTNLDEHTVQTTLPPQFIEDESIPLKPGYERIYRFATRDDPESIRSNLSRQPKWYQEGMYRQFEEDASKLESIAYVHAKRGEPEHSPFVPVLVDLEKGPRTTDDWVSTIIWGQPGFEDIKRAPHLAKFIVPKDRLTEPSRNLSKTETERMFLGDDLNDFLEWWIDNPFYGPRLPPID